MLMAFSFIPKMRFYSRMWACTVLKNLKIINFHPICNFFRVLKLLRVWRKNEGRYDRKSVEFRDSKQFHLKLSAMKGLGVSSCSCDFQFDWPSFTLLSHQMNLALSFLFIGHGKDRRMPVPQRRCVLFYIQFDSELNAEQNCKESWSKNV